MGISIKKVVEEEEEVGMCNGEQFHIQDTKRSANINKSKDSYLINQLMSLSMIILCYFMVNYDPQKFPKRIRTWTGTALGLSLRE